jgi:hypothetical protein
VDADSQITIVDRRDGTRDQHRRSASGWQIDHSGRDEPRTTQLRGLVRQPDHPSVRQFPAPEPRAFSLRPSARLKFSLGSDQYRRSEESWDEAGRPTARIELCYVPAVGSQPNELRIDLEMSKSGPLTFAPVDAANPYDNEPPDISGDGVQLYLIDASGATGWVLVPVSASAEQGMVRTRLIEGWTASRSISATWRATAGGWALHLQIPFDAGASQHEFGLGIVINEKPPGRDRRRGQLVLGGAPGGFVYLRGDREERERLPRFHIAP